MRDSIAIAAAGLGSVLAALLILAAWRPKQGRHTAPYLSARTPAPDPAPVSPWSRPWTGPTKAEAAAYFRQQSETTLQLRIIGERRRAAALATLGVDHPYSYPGDHFQRLAARSASGESA